MDKGKITVIPHLAFKGSCEEALNTYIKAFGGEIYYLSRWSQETFQVTEEQVGKVIHAEFALGNSRMSASDSYTGGGENTDFCAACEAQGGISVYWD